MKNKNSGFTLLELMTVVAISSILTMVGIPAFRSMITTNEVTSKTNDLIMSLKLARSSAITSGHDASVCSSDDGKACKDAAGSWGNGWIVWVDLDNNGALTTTAGSTELIWVKEIDSGSSQTIVPSGDFTKQVDFKYNGALDITAQGSFQICSGTVPKADGFPPRNIFLTISGDVRFEKDITPGNEC